MLTVTRKGVGDDTSTALKEWLAKNPVDEHVRVTLGPDGSFFIWDSKHIGWHGIPDGLQKAIQSWLGPTGWIKGPPRIVTLGPKGSYFALSEYGSVAFSVDNSLKPASAAFSKLKDEVARGSFAYDDLEVSKRHKEAMDFFWPGLTCRLCSSMSTSPPVTTGTSYISRRIRPSTVTYRTRWMRFANVPKTWSMQRTSKPGKFNVKLDTRQNNHNNAGATQQTPKPRGASANDATLKPKT